MKALLVSEYGALNGGEFSFLAALPKLQAAGFEFSAALPGESDFAQLLRNSSACVVPYSFHESGIKKQQALIRDELRANIEQLKPAIVHANSLAASRMLGPVTADMDSVVGLGYLRDIIKLSRKAIDDINQLDQIVAVSHATADFHIHNGMSKEKIQVIHNGVDLERFKPNWKLEGVASKPQRNICLCIGQIGMRKGIDLSLKMLRHVFKQVPDAELWIVGQRHSQKQESFDYEAELHQFAQENFASGKVKWLGRRTDIPDLMRQAKLLVHGAKQEPLGRVLLEATAAGLPMVTTNVGGTPEILAGHEDLMFAPASFDDAAAKATALLTDQNLHRETSQSLRRTAELKFASHHAGNELRDCYLRTIETSS